MPDDAVDPSDFDMPRDQNRERPGQRPVEETGGR